MTDKTFTDATELPAVGFPVQQTVRPLGADVLHCYAQAFWHCEAYVSGSREALLKLRGAIDQALESGRGDCEVSASDGEWYTLYVVAMSDADAEAQVVPYADEIAAQDWNGRPGPWDVFEAA